MQMDLTAVIRHIQLLPALVITKRHHGAHVLLGHKQGNRHDRFANLKILPNLRHTRRAFNLDHTVIAQHDFVHDRRRGRDDIHIKLALKTLLHDLHVQ